MSHTWNRRTRKQKNVLEQHCAACSRKPSAHPVYMKRWDGSKGVLCELFVSVDQLRGLR